MVRYQLSKRQQGTHKALGRAEVSRTGKKMYKQKGTGGARHHSARAPQFRGGGRATVLLCAAMLMTFQEGPRLALRHTSFGEGSGFRSSNT